ncbi:AAA family ATPase [Phenylobacterium sp.]|uniref:AAA family ATPase n=1 Tax=Phenylobacterium sp. TaxID=1871053 RepID=UPI0035AE066D
MQKPKIDLPKLTRAEIRGFRSVEAQDIEFSNLDVLIGPNGAGKSSVIGFLQMLGYMLSSESGLDSFVGGAGGASQLLHDGPKRTPQIEAQITVSTRQGLNDYRFRLGYAANDTLIFLEEKCRFSSAARKNPNEKWIDLGVGHRSPQLLKASNGEDVGKTKRTILRLMQGLRVYQFHDTSRDSRLKQKSPVDDVRYLRSDAGNLGSFLRHMRNYSRDHYDRIVDTLRLVAPFFDDFVLEPTNGRVLLQWRERGTEFEFGPDQISDGTLRLMALLTLLLQPPDTLPPMIIIDEPELGLHPAAVRLVAGILKATSLTHQCLVATQSPLLLNEFDPEAVLVVERKGRATDIRRLHPEMLTQWLDEYQLSDLWDMNVLGGRPEPIAAE